MNINHLSSILLLVWLIARGSDGQIIEPVVAALSVIPTTQILATGGVIGLKLAIASRILRAIGYGQEADQLDARIATSTP